MAAAKETTSPRRMNRMAVPSIVGLQRWSGWRGDHQATTGQPEPIDGRIRHIGDDGVSTLREVARQDVFRDPKPPVADIDGREKPALAAVEREWAFRVADAGVGHTVGVGC